VLITQWGQEDGGKNMGAPTTAWDIPVPGLHGSCGGADPSLREEGSVDHPGLWVALTHQTL